FHTGSKTAWADFTSLSVMAQAMASSSCPALMSCWMSESNRPVSRMSAMMIGLDVAPVAPKARLRAISSGSTESSHSLVPQATSDCSGVMTVPRGKRELQLMIRTPTPSSRAMSQYAAFLAAIRENPDDDTPRLAFADWLAENGEPERGELIRAQVQQ